MTYKLFSMNTKKSFMIAGFKAYFPFVFLMLFAHNAYSQTEKKDLLEADLHLVGLSFSYEKTFSESFAIRANAGYNGTFSINNSDVSSGKKIGFIMQPTVRIQPRYYYNMAKRKEQGKNVAYNSANFFSAHVEYRSSEINISNENLYNPEILNFGVAWNLRRNIANTKFVYEASAGLGYNYQLDRFYKSDDKVVPQVNFKLGYVFN